jgi:hypothetical protein
MNLFLDANAYLTFYRLSKEDLEELRKLIVEVKQRETTLFVTEQVQDEFRRNRESVIEESLKRIREANVPTGYPQIFISHPGFKALRTAVDGYDQERQKLIDEIRKDAAEHKLGADRLISDLFDLAKRVPATPAIVASARERFDRGNPPGKNDSYGDAINWESLLSAVPNSENLNVVSADLDFASKLDSGQLSEFLSTEWDQKKGSTISLYRSLSSLFQEKYPSIKLASELEKELAIGRLVGSYSFLSTHAAIGELNKYSEFTPDQVNAMGHAAVSNDQITSILNDHDVRSFYFDLITTYPDDIDSDDLRLIWTLFGEGEDDN